jgi:methylated-DNA-[protein]-cysteine S-methyltransferase
MQEDAIAVGYITSWAGRTRVAASERGVRSVWLPSWRTGEPAAGPPEARDVVIEPGGTEHARAHLRQALGELADYFAGTRRSFTVPLDVQGPAFFQRIWAAVAAVPYGETRSYLEIAREVQAPEAVRAVGTANGSNPVAPFVPCHRIIGSDGALVGYGPGLPLKRRLLAMEDAMPASESDYPAWVERLAARMRAEEGDGQVVLGMRGRGTYCRPECAHARRAWERPARIFRDPEDARAAGFRACAVCRPDAIARYAATPLFIP